VVSLVTAPTWTFPNCTVLRVVDGDTVDLDVDQGLGTHRYPQRVRIAHINAPEKSTPEGVRSAAWLSGLLPEGTVVTLVSLGWDKYGGRIDGELKMLDGYDVGQTLVNEGYALPWTGKGARP
jgi:endonuclease YncB( thermonuclease family)